MKKIIIILIILSAPALVKCQENNNPKNQWDVNFPTVTQQEPFYPAGDQALFTYIRNNIKFSQAAVNNKVKGNLMLSFDVLPDSTLTSIFVINGMGTEIDNQVVSLLSPLKYAPGIQSGIKVKMNVMLSFTVSAQ